MSRAVRSLLGALSLAGVFVACGDDPAATPPSTSDGGAGQAGMPDSGGSAGTLPQGGSDSAAGEGGAGNPSTGAGAGGENGSAAGAGGAGGEAVMLPRHVPYPPTPYPAENPDSVEKALLGKILFWDEQLGGDNTVACGTCHRPNAGGSDPRSSTAAAALAGPDNALGTDDDIHGSLGVVRCNSQGVHTGASVQVTGRKAPTYLDAMFNPRLFWDGRAECSKQGCPTFNAFEDPERPGTFPIVTGAALENQAVGPPLSDVEMACEQASWAGIHGKLATATPLALAKQIPKPMSDFIAAHGASYPELFKAAFGATQTSGPETEINTRRIAFAIATHERRLRSDQTPWDRWNAGEEDALTPAQVRGFDLFLNKAKCEGCHRIPLFADGDFHFIGFHEPAWDLGRKNINTEFGVPGAMRTPTLRNVGLREATGLLHNGAGTGASLAEIVDLYDLGGLVDSPTVVAAPIDASIVPLDLSEDEKADLLDFLQNGLEDPRVGAQLPPFDRPLLSTE
jgi:cytochrome c peroxidase